MLHYTVRQKGFGLFIADLLLSEETTQGPIKVIKPDKTMITGPCMDGERQRQTGRKLILGIIKRLSV